VQEPEPGAYIPSVCLAATPLFAIISCSPGSLKCLSGLILQGPVVRRLGPIDSRPQMFWKTEWDVGVDGRGVG
jgi:hypothetical protein